MRILLPLAHGTALAAALIAATAPAAAAPRAAAAATARTAARVGLPPVGTTKPSIEKWLSIGEGELITLPAAVAEVWTSNAETADVYVANPRQIHLFGKANGEATIFATDRAGALVYSATVRVAQNATQVDRMLQAALPGTDFHVTLVGQIAVLNGTAASPADAEQAQRLVTGLLNPGVDPTAEGATLKIGIINRIKVPTPLQVNLQVRFAEVSRNFLKNIANNITTRGLGRGNPQLGVGFGRQGSITTVPGVPGTNVVDANNARPGDTLFTLPGITNGGGTFSLFGRLLGTDYINALDLGETLGQVTTLASPNLTALSGETGTFLAGGEIPIPIAQALGTNSIEYKQFGVSLAYTPTVLSDGRISLRVKPEVSQLDYGNAVSVGNGRIPALTTRRAETTVELGSGQSFMIAGLMQNTHNNSYTKTPGIGDLPILGALFRSNGFQRNETELVIVITPYLVRPVNNPADIKLPTDGYKAPTDLERVFLGKLESGNRADTRPTPQLAPPAPAPAPATPSAPARRGAAAPTPGFSIN
ncbi:pilus assembly protein CpaC [Sphingomonas sp. BE138]|uniref:type II and III secretion system protein family protein n=1 Tax=Sphingomonas sp. BE138 TaxID=2817845 RepID=UPI00285F62BD|nr:type II and III secretion system protein family protein [Sphingomonas sp. BE138]MDR6786884.1 pilus assembly protein CpaC [Sphingomonas sp. BE138]